MGNIGITSRGKQSVDNLKYYEVLKTSINRVGKITNMHFIDNLSC